MSDDDIILFEEWKEIFWVISISTILTVGICYLIAGIIAYRALKKFQQSTGKNTWKNKMKLMPFGFLLLGILISSVPSFLSASIIAALYVHIPYAISLDYGCALGVGQALIFVYIHWGKMQFLHKI
eukprot:209546_1